MTDLNALWNKAKSTEQEEGFSTIPEGKYEAYVDRVKYDETKTPAVVTLTWKITGPTHAKRLLFANYRMEEIGMGRLKGDILSLGLIVVDFNKLADELPYLVGKTGTLTVKHKADKNGKVWENTYLDRKVSGTKGTTNTSNSDEIPF